MNIWEWIKNNKLSAFLLLILAFIIGKNLFPNFAYRVKYSQPIYDAAGSNESILPKAGGGALGTPSLSGIAPLISREYAPAPEVKDRLVIQNSYLSLLVKNVRETADKIIEYTKTNGGYMVNSFLENPQESPTGNVTIRLPAKNLSSVLEYFRSQAIKVVSENLSGEDVTDQYTDIEARLVTLNKTKAKFEEILERAAKVQDILEVQREIINLQSQIDSYKGQQQYLEKSSQMAKITIYLSTDEIALPYAPTEAWRPDIIFKLAVRSMIGRLRKVGTALIWLAVYSIIWVPLLIIFLLIRKKLRKN